MSEILVIVALELVVSILSAIIGSNMKYNFANNNSYDSALFAFFITLAVFSLINIISYNVHSGKSVKPNSRVGLFFSAIGGGFGAYVAMDGYDILKNTPIAPICCCSKDGNRDFQNACCASVFLLVIVIAIQFIACLFLFYL